jgi:MFS family permease
MVILLCSNFLVFLGFNFFYVSFPPFALSDDVGWSLRELGFFYAILSLMMAITQGPILSRASTKFSQGFLMILGSLILAIGFVVIIVGSTIAFFVAAVAISIGNGLLYPSLLAVLASHGKGDMQGKVQGIASSFGSVASIIGLIFGGILFEKIGKQVFVISSIIMLVLALMSARFAAFELEHSETQVHHHTSHKFLGSHYLHHLTEKREGHLDK